MALDLVLYRRRNYRFTSKSRTPCSCHDPVVYAIGVFKVVARQRRNTCNFCVIIRVEHFGRAALFSLPRIWALVPISFQFWKQVCCPFRSVVGSWSIILSFRKKKREIVRELSTCCKIRMFHAHGLGPILGRSLFLDQVRSIPVKITTQTVQAGAQFIVDHLHSSATDWKSSELRLAAQKN